MLFECLAFKKRQLEGIAQRADGIGEHMVEHQVQGYVARGAARGAAGVAESAVGGGWRAKINRCLSFLPTLPIALPRSR